MLIVSICHDVEYQLHVGLYVLGYLMLIFSPLFIFPQTNLFFVNIWMIFHFPITLFYEKLQHYLKLLQMHYDNGFN